MGFLERILRSKSALAQRKNFGHPGEYFTNNVRYFALVGTHNVFCAEALARALFLQ